MAHDLAEFIVRSIVSVPEAISITEGEKNGKRVLRLQVSSKDVARVMGSRGLVIRAIRTIITSVPTDIEDVVVETAAPAGSL